MDKQHLNTERKRLEGNTSQYDNRIYLRALELGDLERTCHWHNDPALYATLTDAFHFVSEAAERVWLEQRTRFSREVISLAICLSESNEHIGNLYLRDIDWVARRADVSIFIGSQPHRGHGYGEAAMRLVLVHAFDDLGLQRIYLFVLASNAPAIRLYEKCGFTEEGRLHRHAFKEGRFEDVLVMGVLRPECAAPND